MNRKKVFLLGVLFVLLSSTLNAKINCFWDIGRVSAEGVFNEESGAFCPVLEIPDIYFVGEKTGIFTSVCPFVIGFKYSPQDYEFEGHHEDWTVDNVSFVNLNLGWMKFLGDDFLLETYVSFSTVNVMNIKKFGFSPSVEFSWTPSFLEGISGDSKIPFMPKALSLRADASFYNTRDFKPDFFVSLSIDFVLGATLAGAIYHL